MYFNVHAISTSVDIPTCTSLEDMQAATSKDAALQRLKSYIIQGLPHYREKVQHGMQKYWPIRHELAMIDNIALKGNQIIIPFTLQNQILEQLQSNHMGTEKTIT